LIVPIVVTSVAVYSPEAILPTLLDVPLVVEPVGVVFVDVGVEGVVVGDAHPATMAVRTRSAARSLLMGRRDADGSS
jgi:hypothetical protein